MVRFHLAHRAFNPAWKIWIWFIGREGEGVKAILSVSVPLSENNVWRNAINKQTKIFYCAKKCKGNFGFGTSQQQQQQQQKSINYRNRNLDVESLYKRWRVASWCQTNTVNKTSSFAFEKEHWKTKTETTIFI